MYAVGDTVALYDKVNEGEYHNGVIKYIEKDTHIPELYWIYIRANEEELNDKMDPRFSYKYWQLVENTSQFLTKVEIS